MFPPEIVAPACLWNDESRAVDQWFIVVNLTATHEALRFSTRTNRWKPAEADWERIKRESV
ncbi:MAG: hypothetical protein GY944_30660, partial [bacterium]|nr:hypothetical protein [bacterium]